MECVRLVQAKLQKLRAQLEKLALSKNIPRNSWKARSAFCGGPRALASACAPLYKDLRSSKGMLRSFYARRWRRFRDSLSPEAGIAAQPAGMWITATSRLLEVGSTAKQDVPTVPPFHKPQWARVRPSAQ